MTWFSKSSVNSSWQGNSVRSWSRKCEFRERQFDENNFSEKARQVNAFLLINPTGQGVVKPPLKKKLTFHNKTEWEIQWINPLSAECEIVTSTQSVGWGCPNWAHWLGSNFTQNDFRRKKEKFNWVHESNALTFHSSFWLSLWYFGQSTTFVSRRDKNLFGAGVTRLPFHGSFLWNVNLFAIVIHLKVVYSRSPKKWH